MLKRVHFHIPEPLLKKLAAAAKKRGVPLAEEVRSWLQAEADRREGKR